MIVKVMCLAILAASAFSASVIQRAFDSCSPSEFSCGDGACVSADLVCDGATHCASGEDELGCDRGLAQNVTCTLPEYPAHGSYITNIPNAKPGDAYDSVIISITCRDGFIADGSTNIITCFNGVWQNKMPKCVLQCHLPSHLSVDFSCVVSATGGSRACNEYEPSGTVVSPQCRRPIYYSPTTLTYMRCKNGRWSYVARCIPECGTVTSSGEPQIAGGVSARHGEVPWHAGVYSKDKQPYLQICGGSLISTDVVLSAAHCFWTDALDGGAKQLAANFAVAVGKLYRSWNDSTDEAQTSDVKGIHVPARFRGSATHFQDDIAVVIVTKPFEYKWFIRPVCVDFDIVFEKRQLQPGKKGKVAGWGLTAKNGTRSQVLQVIELPYIDIDTCISESPLTFKGQITSDKICAGFKNEGKAVCKGDSGGGLAFADSDKGTTRYYLRGIVSSAPVNDDPDPCNVDFYTTFTEIRSHKQLIKEFWVAAGTSRDDDGGKMPQKEECTLPPYPAHGTYDVINAPTARPGDSLDVAFINVTCDLGYRLKGSNLSYCSNGMWRGQFECDDVDCGKLPPLPNGSAELLNGTTYLDSVVQYSCATNYRLVGPARRTCTDDFQWSETAPTCKRLPCKEESIDQYGVTITPIYSMDDVSLNHYVKLKRNATGHRTYFELHFAVQTDGLLVVGLWEKAYSGIRCSLYIGDGSPQRTALYCNEDEIQTIATPNILSSTEFSYFYIKIDDGKLQFGKEGETLIMSYSGTSVVGSLNYYHIAVFSGSANIRYCPAAIEGLPCKEQSAAYNGYTPWYSMDDVSLNHYGTQKINSTGHRTYLELHFALQTNGYVGVWLSEKEDYSGIGCYLYVGLDRNQRTALDYNNATVQTIVTPNILSFTQFRSFYIKIDDGKLQFGKEGDTPLMSYSDVGIGFLNYYRFRSIGGPTKIRCCPPAAVEEETNFPSCP